MNFIKINVYIYVKHLEINNNNYIGKLTCYVNNNWNKYSKLRLHYWCDISQNISFSLTHIFPRISFSPTHQSTQGFYLVMSVTLPGPRFNWDEYSSYALMNFIACFSACWWRDRNHGARIWIQGCSEEILCVGWRQSSLSSEYFF